jgi:hypothetical protein
VVILPVTDLNVTFPFALMWRKDNSSPLLAKFTADVKSMVEQRDRKGETRVKALMADSGERAVTSENILTSPAEARAALVTRVDGLNQTLAGREDPGPVTALTARSLA